MHCGLIDFILDFIALRCGLIDFILDFIALRFQLLFLRKDLVWNPEPIPTAQDPNQPHRCGIKHHCDLVRTKAIEEISYG